MRTVKLTDAMKAELMHGVASFDNGALSWAMVNSSIPASELVNSLPNVLPAGGAAINMNGLALTTNIRVPIGTVQSFPNQSAVSAYFGASATETLEAGVYFGGFTNATQVPGALLFAQYPQNAVSAYLRGGNVSTLSLTQLQALAGSLNLTVDGYNRPVASISLAGAVSFSNAATIMQSALNGSAPSNLASFTGQFTLSGSMTVTGLSSGTINAGASVSGTGVVGTVVVLSQVSGSVGGTGVYVITSTSGTLGSQALTTAATPIAVTYDSVSGGFIFTSGDTGTLSTIAFATGQLAPLLSLTQSAGAVISQGAAAATPAAFMASVTVQTQNWGTFTTLFNPDAVIGVNTNKLAFAAWTSGTDDRYAYIGWDVDTSPTVSTSAPASFGAQVIAAGYSGTFPIWELSGGHKAAFVMGVAAAINFNQPNGRITFAYKGQAGLSPDVTDPTTAANLSANGYNFYGAYGTATQTFQFLQPGSVSGPFKWMDSYINQIWLNANFQSTWLNYLATITSTPYNPAGYAGLENVLQSPINAGLAFGAYRAGVTLSSSQIQEINAAAGANVAGTVGTRGWYLQLLDPGSVVRAARGSPIINFWYADGEAIQLLTMSSIDVQ